MYLGSKGECIRAGPVLPKCTPASSEPDAQSSPRISEEAERMKGKGKLVRTLGAEEREGLQKKRENQTQEQVQ